MDLKTINLFLMLPYMYFLTLIIAILYGDILVLKSRQECSSSRKNLQDIYLMQITLIQAEVSSKH